ncbi:hypothetical protein [Mesorhizobium sp. M0239]|uniref:hypothetical protein n=1 Tax=Mesorhizobium sp. M0239 TaxID=2956924 RepID=UPI00333537E9
MAVSGGDLRAVGVDHAHHCQCSRGDDNHLQTHRHALEDDDAKQGGIGPQQSEVGAGQPQRMLAHIEHDQDGDHAYRLADQRRRGGACDTELGKRPDAADEQWVEHDVEDDGQSHEEEGRA